MIRNIGQKCLFTNVLFKYLNRECLKQHSFTSTVYLCKINKTTLASNTKHFSENNFTEKSKTSHDGDFVVRLKNDPDIFGEYDEPEILDEGDLKEEKHFTEQVAASKKLSTKQYADIIKGYIQQRKIKEAIDVLEVKMLKEDKVKPENYIFNLIIGACGRVGYTKKAFMLYNNMKKRGLIVTGGTYTALFNACANSPWPEDGLTRAKHLREIMIEKQYIPSDTTYNAMIKAFGRCGDLETAFALADEMANNGIAVKADTISFLLQACISDKEAGFRHSLLVWRKIIEKNIVPNIYIFNLLLRCVRDCELGDLEVTQDVIGRLLGESDNKHKLLQPPQRSQIEQPPSDQNSLEISHSNQLTDSGSPNIDCRPNLLAKVPHLGNILSLSEVKKPEDRLLLLGGCSGFLSTMKLYKASPDIKTFTVLLDTIPSTNAAEKELLKEIKKHSIQPDIDFYNMLIKKRSMRFDYIGAREVLEMMRQKFRPNVMTYGMLALGCKTREEALELIDEMKSANYRLNAVILGAMLRQACCHWSFPYIFEVMELFLKESVPVSKKLIQILDDFKNSGNEKLAKKECSPSQEKSFNIFKARYKTWLEQVQIDETEDAHPWQQYRQTYPEEINYKWKEGVRFKPRHISKFKVKTSTKERY